MININEVTETNAMIEKENLDVRTITLGISLLDCVSDNLERLNDNIYRKITTVARDLVRVGRQIEREYALPIVNKRISVTPVSIIGASACHSVEDYVSVAKTLDRAAKKQIKADSARLQKLIGKCRLEKVTEAELSEIREAKQALQNSVDTLMHR